MRDPVKDKEIDDHMRQVEARGTQPKPKPCNPNPTKNSPTKS